MRARRITIGGKGRARCITMGGGAPPTIQTMYKEGIRDLTPDALSKIVQRIEALGNLGCDILRFAVPDMESAHSLCTIASAVAMPLVADIHYDYRLALECLKGDVAVIRINPGNIGGSDRVSAVVSACKDRGVAIRIGVNSGSLPRELLAKVARGECSLSGAMEMAALQEAQILEGLGFHSYLLSMKASSIEDTVEANLDFAKKYDTPLHIGITEAGPLIGGIVKTTIACNTLLKEGVGDTIRVSLSDTPETEVMAARAILDACHKRSGGVRLISCPRCGREGFDVHSFVARWQERLLALPKDISVAVMGCVVNGPGEASRADIGITGAGSKVMIFKKGKIVSTTTKENADNVFREELESL